MTDNKKLLILIILTVSFLGYSAVLYTEPPAQKGEAYALDTPENQGKILWQEKNCTSCHQFYGLGGHLGPDLTNVTSKRSPAYIEAFLKSGTDVMPNFNLTQDEVDALMAFLKAVDNSGESDPRTFKIKLDGTISK